MSLSFEQLKNTDQAYAISVVESERVYAMLSPSLYWNVNRCSSEEEYDMKPYWTALSKNKTSQEAIDLMIKMFSDHWLVLQMDDRESYVLFFFRRNGFLYIHDSMEMFTDEQMMETWWKQYPSSALVRAEMNGLVGYQYHEQLSNYQTFRQRQDDYQRSFTLSQIHSRDEHGESDGGGYQGVDNGRR